MTTLLSKNEENSIELKMTGYLLKDGDRLLVGVKEEIEKAEKFLDNHGFGGLYFDPSGEVEVFNDFMFESAIDSDAHGIRFFN